MRYRKTGGSRPRDSGRVRDVQQRLLMTSTALVLGAAGIAASFMPHAVLVEFGVTPLDPLPVLVQILGALLFGFSMLNWLARGLSIGGIYGRPIVVGNLAHFVIGAFALLKASGRGDSVILFSAGGIYAVFAIWFGLVLFSRPPSKDVAGRE
jgi:hypothetical protein